MGQCFLRTCACVCALLFAGNALATNYEITSTDDAVANDGQCTLREAVQAVSGQAAVNECAAGTVSNTIRLTEGATYNLSGGMLEVGVAGGGQTVNLTIDVIRDGPFDETDRDNPVIVQTSSTQRAFYVHQGSNLTLRNLTVLGGNVSGGQAGLASDPDDDGRGGQVYAQGNLLLDEGSMLSGGAADEGGAVYLAQGGMEAVDTSFVGHSATGDGGAIAMSNSSARLLLLERTYFGGNTAGGDGGALFVDGTTIGADMVNSTFYDNTANNGAAIHFTGDARFTSLNNITIAGNTGVNGGLSYADGITSHSDILYNSAIVGNIGGDCFQSGTALDDADIQYTVSGTSGTCTNGSYVPSPAGTRLSATFEVFQGEAPCAAAPGPGSCTPRTFDNGLSGFLPNQDSLVSAGVTVLDQGSPVFTTDQTCATFDQREVAREDACDAGAVELRIARGVTDEFNLITGRATSIDVLANDLGEVGIDCAQVLPLATFPLSAPSNDPSVEPCLAIVVTPNRGTLTVNIDAQGYPSLTYQSVAGFHGVDNFRYEVPDTAFTGKTLGDRGAAAAAFLVVEPVSGLTESTNINDESGSMAPGALLLSLALIALRRARRLAPALLVAWLVSGQAGAADIRVDSLDDTVTARGDGICTVREALGNAIDNNPVFSPDCSPGATGSDRILLPAGTLSLTRQLDVVGSSVVIEGQGPGLTIIRGPGTSGGNLRLIQARNSLTLRNLTLADGNVSGDGGAIFTSTSLSLDQVELLDNRASGDGGAIYRSANPAEATGIEMETVYARGNQAVGRGGFMFTFGQNQNYSIEVLNSTFYQNASTAGPGVFDLNMSKGRMAVVNSTFTDNTGAAGFASAIDTQDSPVDLIAINSTFLNYGGGSGAVDAGPNDGGNNGLRLYNTIYANAGTCSSDVGATPEASEYNIFDDTVVTPDTTCGESDSTNTSAAIGDITLVLSNANLVFPSPAFSNGVYTVPHFPIDIAEEGNGAWNSIVDAGNPAEQFTGANNPVSCRTTDLRGESRLAGADPTVPEGCDLGAYELQVATAIADTGSNRNRRGRFAIIDVLANDLPGEGAEILTGSISFGVPLPAGATLSTVRRSNNEASCSPGDDCVVRFEAPTDLVCPDDFDPDPPVYTFTYTFDADDGSTVNTSSPGEVTVTVLNVPIYFDSQEELADRGEKTVFPLVAEDVDGTIDWSTLKLGTKPLFAARNDNGTPDVLDDDTILGTGVIVDVSAGTVTYVPRDITKAFNDTFSLSVLDDCGTESVANFRVVYRNDSAAGGELGSGSMGWSWPVLLCLLVRRRRRA